jgi:hypothetical protein
MSGDRALATMPSSTLSPPPTIFLSPTAQVSVQAQPPRLVASPYSATLELSFLFLVLALSPSTTIHLYTLPSARSRSSGSLVQEGLDGERAQFGLLSAFLSSPRSFSVEIMRLFLIFSPKGVIPGRHARHILRQVLNICRYASHPTPPKIWPGAESQFNRQIPRTHILHVFLHLSLTTRARALDGNCPNVYDCGLQ